MIERVFREDIDKKGNPSDLVDSQLILDDTLCSTDSTPNGENFRERFIKALVCIRSHPHSKSDTVCTMGKWMILGDGKPGLLRVWPCDTLYRVRGY